MALSSCEAEINGLIKCASEALQMHHMAEIFGRKIAITLKTDASAARGVMHRMGGGEGKQQQQSNE